METLLILVIFSLIVYALYCISYVVFQEKFLFRAKKLPADFKHPCLLPHEELFLKTEDGETINALLVHPQHQKGIVIYFHGNMLHLTNYLPYISKFTDAGYAVLMPDYRSFGKSTGELTEENFFSDTLLIYEWARRKFPNAAMIIYGRSMGSAAACYLASKRNCKLLLLEAPFYSLIDLSWFYGLPLLIGRYLKFAFRNNEFLMQVKSPVTILHGTKDAIVSYRSGKKLQRCLKEGDRFITIEGGGHNNLEQFSMYHAALDSVLA